MARGAGGRWRSFERRTPGSRTRRPDREPSGATSASESSTWRGGAPRPDGRGSGAMKESIPKDEFRIPNGLAPSSPKDPPHRESGISQVPSHPFTDSQGLWKNPFRRANSGERIPESEFRRANSGERIPESEFRRANSGERIPESEFRRANSGERIPYSVLRIPNSEWARALE